jgi:hypothetical protein
MDARNLTEKRESAAEREELELMHALNGKAFELTAFRTRAAADPMEALAWLLDGTGLDPAHAALVLERIADHPATARDAGKALAVASIFLFARDNPSSSRYDPAGGLTAGRPRHSLRRTRELPRLRDGRHSTFHT